MEHEKKPHIDPAAKAAAETKILQHEHGVPEKKHVAAQAPGSESAHEKKHDAPAEKAQNEIEQVFTELSDRLLRLTAEFDNYKKRTAREKEELCHASESRLMLRLLPSYEEAGLAAKEVEKISDEAIRKGVMMVLGNIRASFEKEGLQPMKLEGEKLDPFRHEVALREESDAPEGTIMRTIRAGYLYKGAVLQHAIVSVSSGEKLDGEVESKDEKKMSPNGDNSPNAKHSTTEVGE